MFRFFRANATPQFDPEQVIAAEIESLSTRRIYHDDCIAELDAEIARTKGVIERASELKAQHTIARDVTLDAIVAYTAHVAAADALSTDALLLEAAE